MGNLAYWKDAGERVLSTFVEAVLGVVVVMFTAGNGWQWDSMVWQTVIFVTVIAALKAVIAGLPSGNMTGASFGTAVPAGQVVAAKDTNTNKTVSGPAYRGADGLPVAVTPAPQAGQ